MSDTHIPFGSPQAAKQFGAGLFIYQQKDPNIIRNMSAPMTSEAIANSRVEKQQTSPGMPVVEIMELTKVAGDRVQVDTMDVTYSPPIMGDQNIEGRGAKLDFSEMEIRLDQWGFVTSAGGRMTQQRSPYQLRKLAMSRTRAQVAAYTGLTGLVHLAGQRGSAVGGQWGTVPLSSSAEYAETIVNAFDATDVSPPTENRYFVADGNQLLSGSAAFTQIAGGWTTADTLQLAHFDQLRNTIDALALSLQCIKVPGDELAIDDPMWLMLTPSPAYSNVLTETSGIRTFQQNGMERTKYNNAKHPLFNGIVGGWNGVMAKKLTNVISFNNGDVIRTLQANGTVRNTTVSGIPAGHRLYRCILVGAQALCCAYGRDTSSGSPYSWSEKKLDHDRKVEFAAFGISAYKKTTFSVPNEAGTGREPTDFGTIVIDVIAKIPTT